MHIELTSLWQVLADEPSDPLKSERDLLRAELSRFRTHASVLVRHVAAAFPNLTIHDISHLDALWDIGSIIAGPSYDIKPKEAFCFGGAVLLHDAALCFEAYDGGRDAVRNTITWKDAFALVSHKH